MNLPIFQFCLDFIESKNQFGLVFPEESNDFLSMAFAIPITEIELQNQKIESTFYFPTFQNNESRRQEFSFDNFSVSSNVFNTEIKFELIDNFPFKYSSTNFNPTNLNSYFVLNYLGEYTQFTKSFRGFIPMKISNNDKLNELYKENNFSLIGFTPKFGSQDWLNNI